MPRRRQQQPGPARVALQGGGRDQALPSLPAGSGSERGRFVAAHQRRSPGAAALPGGMVAVAGDTRSSRLARAGWVPRRPQGAREPSPPPRGAGLVWRGRDATARHLFAGHGHRGTPAPVFTPNNAHGAEAGRGTMPACRASCVLRPSPNGTPAGQRPPVAIWATHPVKRAMPSSLLACLPACPLVRWSICPLSCPAESVRDPAHTASEGRNNVWIV